MSDTSSISRRCRAISDIGTTRTANEDTHACNDEIGIYAVADGMGGHSGGKIASVLACRVVSDHLSDVLRKQGSDLDRVRYLAEIKRSMLAANSAIRSRNGAKQGLDAMGTTLSVVLVAEDVAYYGNVGDTRIYLVDRRNEDIIQLSEDHTLEWDYLKTGAPPQLAKRHRHTLTQCLGTNATITPNVGMARIHEGISILICSDGLYNYLSDRELHECLSPSEEKDPLLLEHLLAIAIERGGEDNITAVLVDFG